MQLRILYPTINAAILPLVKGGVGPISTTVISRHFPQPYSLQWTLSVSRELPGNMSLESAYVGNHAVNANAVLRVNKVDPVTGQRPFAGYSEYNYYEGGESVRYNAWQNTFRRRFRNGLQIGAVYTWANTISYTNTANLGYSNPAHDTHNLREDKGPSPFDIRHSYNTEFLYELPLMKLASAGGRGKRLMLGGWQFSGVCTAQTGGPINAMPQSQCFRPSAHRTRRCPNSPRQRGQEFTPGSGVLELGSCAGEESPVLRTLPPATGLRLVQRHEPCQFLIGVDRHRRRQFRPLHRHARRPLGASQRAVHFLK